MEYKMSDVIKINTNNGTFQKIEKSLTIEEYKNRDQWPLDYIAGKGLIHPIKQLGDKVVGLEIGVCRGENIVFFLENCSNIERIHCIDPYMEYNDWNGIITQQQMNEFYEITMKNFERHMNRITLHKDTAKNCVPLFENESLDYIFIDGDHSYSGVLSDMTNYYDKLKFGGIFSGHDINLLEVRNAIIKFREDNKIANEVTIVENNAWYWRK
jgi:hypothetical protein